MSHRKAKKQRKAARQYSTIEEHKRLGQTLTPPILTIPNVAPRSWVDDRLPEMLWAALVVSHLDREAALDVFRAVAKYVASEANRGQLKLSSITHSALAEYSPETQDKVIGIITRDLPQREALRSLLIFEDLPAREAWIRAFGAPLGAIDSTPVAIAVAKTLDHQSQESTDCRWAKVLVMLAAGRLHLPSEELVREIAEYPDFGDQRKVRPSIRASELAFGSMNADVTDAPPWAAQFWAKCLVATPCQLPSNTFDGESPSVIGTTSQRVKEVYGDVIKHAALCLATSAVDPKHDAVFGIVLYALSVLKEVMRPGLGNSIIARMALRSVLESYVTLAYLIKRQDEKLWQSYRVYGAGQAKLSFLKLTQNEELPNYVSVQTLELLANEDRWQEFVKIDLGHWDRSNLRQMSEVAGVKPDYDAFYSWPSAYSHGQWGAVRDAVFATCLNPLHRLHRIPRSSARMLDDVVPDVCVLVDKMLDLVDSAYPSLTIRVRVA